MLTGLNPRPGKRDNERLLKHAERMASAERIVLPEGLAEELGLEMMSQQNISIPEMRRWGTPFRGPTGGITKLTDQLRVYAATDAIREQWAAIARELRAHLDANTDEAMLDIA